jgi:protein O-mannosyl-transferase
VLYVVQRMESMANLFVLLGLLGYVVGRRRMLGNHPASLSCRTDRATWDGFILCAASITVPTVLGILAKETAVMLPLYALLVEWALFRFHRPPEASHDVMLPRQPDLRVIGLFLLVLALPMVTGLAWLLPNVLRPETWAARDFTLGTRLLSEARIITDYIAWTLLPTPDALSFYHDDFRVSTGLLAPLGTLTSIVFLAALVALMLWLRPRRPLATLGIALFLGCQLLTGTVLPLELIYEHRNYFASFGLLLAITPLLAVPRGQPLALPRHVLLAGLLLCWTVLTAMTAYAWGNPLRLAEDLAARAPQSPRAQYELGRTYIIYSHYDPASPFTRLAYAPLEKSASLPNSSILPEQALIFMNARMKLPLKDAWWDSMIAKLRARRPGVQDESSLGALTQCAHEGHCDLPQQRMMDAFMAALAHPDPSARLLATYGDYAWNVLEDHSLGERMTEEAVKASPYEPAYQITLIRMLATQGRTDEAHQAIQQLQKLNVGGRLDEEIHALRIRLGDPSHG